MIISNKRILFRIINEGNKLPNSFTNIFKALDVIGLGCFNFLVFDIYSHTSQRLLDIVGIRGKMF